MLLNIYKFINFINVRVTRADLGRWFTQPSTVYMAKSDPARRVTRRGRLGNPPSRVTSLIM